MGKYRFERATGCKDDGQRQIINFDSSPKFSITKQFGYAEKDFELRETKRDSDRYVHYDVYARVRSGGSEQNPEYGKLEKRGTLRETTTEELSRMYG